MDVSATVFTDSILRSQQKAKTPISKVTDFYSKELTKTLEALAEVSAKINIIEMVTPVNYVEQRDNWKKAARADYYDQPKFVYDRDLLEKILDLKPQFANVKAQAEEVVWNELKQNEVSAETAALMKLLADRVYMVDGALNLAQQMFMEHYIQAGKTVPQLFGVSPNLGRAKNYAMQLVTDGCYDETEVSADDAATNAKLREITINAEGIRKAFLWAAKELGIADSRPVEILPNISSIDVRDASSDGPKVLIPADRKVSGQKLLSLVAHEVFGHWLDSEVAKEILPYFGAGALKDYDETLYEGHAMTLEHDISLKYMGMTRSLALPYYVIAEDMAMKGYEFPMVAVALHSMMSPILFRDAEVALEHVWKTCYRTFRGTDGPDNKTWHYAFLKDRAYFDGRILAAEMQKANLDYLLGLATLSPKDLLVLTEVFKITPEDLPDRSQHNKILEKLAKKIANGDFTQNS